MELTIELLQRDDITKLIPIMKAAFMEAPWWEQWTDQACQARLDEVFSFPHSKSFVLQDQDNIIGALLGRYSNYMEDKLFVIEEFFIDPREQNKGYGKMLLKHLLLQLKKENINKVTLLTRKDSSVEKFYERQGFRISNMLNLMEIDL